MSDQRSRLALAVGLLSLIVFLPGQRPSNDPRFVSPAAPVNSFWQAILDGEQGRALECFVGVGRQAAHTRVLELPTVDELELKEIKVTPQGTDRAIVRYQVHYRMKGGQASAFASADEVMLVRGEWRILHPMDGERKDLPVPQRRPKAHVVPGPEYASGPASGPRFERASRLTAREGAC